MVKIERLSFSYGNNHVLEDVSFALKEGQAVALLGRNGSGKSTLLKIMLGLLKPSSGSVLLDGKESLSIKERSKLVAYIPQYSTDVFSQKVIDTVVLGKAGQMQLFARPGKEDYREAEERLAELGIESLRNRPMNKLSGGERQLVLISRALMQDAKTLLLDEPTASLDYSNQIMVMEKIKALTGKGYSALFSTHNPELALMYADSIVLLDDGKSEFIEKPESLVSSDRLSKLYRRDLHISIVDTGKNRRISCLPE